MNDVGKKCFKDLAGREWNLNINIGAMRRAKTQNIDLSMPVNQLREFVMDDVFMVDAIWAVIQPDADAKGISKEQFESAIDGKAIESARDALWVALEEYYPDPKAQMLRAALNSVAAETANAMRTLNSADLKGN